jgi:hypothetical protein
MPTPQELSEFRLYDLNAEQLMLFLMLRGIYLAQSRRDTKVRVLDTLFFKLLPDRTYTLTVNAKYDLWISGVKP